MVPHHSHAPGKPSEGLELKTGQINTLKLFGGIRHGRTLLAAGTWLVSHGQ